MMLIIRLIHKLAHLTDIVVHLESIASEDNESDPSPYESDHALKELLLSEGKLGHFKEVLTVVFEDLGEHLEGVQVLKGRQGVQKLV
jgi:hypothetical protein